MVSFTCENCGDTLKDDVAQHVGECKGPFPLTCIHCKGEFYDDQYTLHSSCASEVRDVEIRLPAQVPETKSSITVEEKPSRKVETRSSSKIETRPSGKIETKPSGNVETTPCVKVELKSDWIRAIDRVSQSPSLTSQQSSLLAALANLHNVPKKRAAFGKFALSHWKVSDASECVINEVFLLIHEQTMNVPVHWPRSLSSQEPTWVAAMRAACRGRRVPPLHKKILDKVLSYQKNNPVPLSLPNQKSFENLIRVVCKDESINPHVINEVFDSILLEMGKDSEQNKPNGSGKITAPDAMESEEVERPSEVANKKNKSDKKRFEDGAEILKVEAEIAVEEVTQKKSKKKKHKRREEDSVEDEVVLRKKSTRSA